MEKEPKSWKIPDELWEEISGLIPNNNVRKPGVGRPAADKRAVLEAILYRANTAAHWKDIPKRFPASSSVHRYFLLWKKQGIFEKLYSNTQLQNMPFYKIAFFRGIDWKALGIKILQNKE